MFWFEIPSISGASQGFSDNSARRPGTPFYLHDMQNFKLMHLLLRTLNVSGLTGTVDRRMQKSGCLMDGTMFASYRVLLYCNEFSSLLSLYPQCSAGGYHMLPLGYDGEV